MKEIDRTKGVLVTGATGYVAGHVVKELLKDGLRVHAAVRNPDSKEKTQYLQKLSDDSSGEIVFFKADLLEEGSYDEAMRDCELVFHTASPFTMSVNDPQRELVDPALLGTRNVLESANRTESVKRVVLTSSVAAILGDSKDLIDLPNGTATEEHWNTSSSLDHNPYMYSKTVAEREAWKIADAQSRWDLVVINPSLVLGPGISPLNTSESFSIMKQLGDGTMKAGVPDLDMGIVDVRDLGIAHFKAGFTPEAKGRHIISNDHRTLLDLAIILRNEFGDAYPFPKRVLPKFLVWLLGPLSGIKRKFISRNVGYPWLVDNTKSKKELGVSYRPIEETVIEFFQQMIDDGVFGN